MARRRILAVVAALAISLAVAAPVSAVKPIRGCSDSFELWGVQAFRDYLNSDAFLDSLSPEGQALAPDILAFINSEAGLAALGFYDKNGDVHLCIKQNPPTKGNVYGWVFNVVDNTANH